MADKKVEVEVSGKAKDEGALGYFDKLAAKAKAIRKDNALSGENALGAMLRGGLGRFGLEAAGGGAALMGIDFMTQAVTKTTERLRELRKLTEDGAGAGEIADKLMEALPVYGELWASGRRLREELSGETRLIEEQNAETERSVRISELRMKAVKAEEGRTPRQLGYGSQTSA